MVVVLKQLQPVIGYFNFKLTQFKEKKAKSYGIKRNSYHLKLPNPKDTFPTGHGNIIRAFEERLARSIHELIRGLPDHDRIQIYLGSNRLRNSHTSANVSVEQWRDPLGASRQVLDNISNLLNSDENFEIDDTLQLDVTYHHATTLKWSPQRETETMLFRVR